MSEFADREFIFIQTPDDMDQSEQEEIITYLNFVAGKKDPRSTFVLVPIGYKDSQIRPK